MPGLFVEEADEGSWAAVAQTFISLAPSGKRFGGLGLLGTRLRAPELRLLLQELYVNGVRTDDDGDTRAGVVKEVVYLHITDRMPPAGPAVPQNSQLQEALHLLLKSQRQ
ncbi:uncharacterized protein LOC108680462 [Hyalella azteca]|uniref:Uncharacterized protein LOC108680462 n=1 Tax=Hyalella azteca TaxID=294128 RepID=A0A8B7PHH2_HYAAZ|nr:uncharacterized protein LOC108680462 [Hyalella azteca]